MSQEAAAVSVAGLVTQIIIASKYGTRLTVDDMAKELRVTPGHLYNQISANLFPCPTFKDGKLRFADYRDFAAYLDACAARASTQVQA